MSYISESELIWRKSTQRWYCSAAEPAASNTRLQWRPPVDSSDDRGQDVLGRRFPRMESHSSATRYIPPRSPGIRRLRCVERRDCARPPRDARREPSLRPGPVLPCLFDSVGLAGLVQRGDLATPEQGDTAWVRYPDVSDIMGQGAIVSRVGHQADLALAGSRTLCSAILLGLMVMGVKYGT